MERVSCGSFGLEGKEPSFYSGKIGRTLPSPLVGLSKCGFETDTDTDTGTRDCLLKGSIYGSEMFFVLCTYVVVCIEMLRMLLLNKAVKHCIVKSIRT